MHGKRQFKPKTLKKHKHRGGAIYSFNLNDKIGGLPARIPLNGTADGDCPATDTMDLGFVNYGMTRTSGGGRRHRMHCGSRSRKSVRKSKAKARKTKTRRKYPLTS